MGHKQKTVIPETGETDEVSPPSRAGEGHQAEPGRPSEFTRGAGRTRKSEALEFSGQRTREARAP